MKHWLRRWLGIETAKCDYDPARIAAIEAAHVALRDEVFSEIAELRERLELPKHKKPSGRPFTVLRALAEEGARRAREKSSA